MTYKALEARVKDLEVEVDSLRKARNRLQDNHDRHREVEKMALLGHWELDLVSNDLYWSDEIYRIFELEKSDFGATYEAFLEAVHPDDREHVNNTYRSSISSKTGYDLVHRLLLRDGTLKYVHEKGISQYDDDGAPLRSLGTVQDVTAQFIETHSFFGIIGKHQRMRDLYETIEELAEVDVPVLIQGESGTGKELVAKAIHAKSARISKPFVPVNCGALPETLLESELFGHVKGAFTGAIRNKRGRFELADGGTLFLDEIADLSKAVQVKLLRVLQEGTFEPVGGENTVSVNVRIISAANRDLREEVARGRFREDLYYRIKVVPIELPPLRRRRSDIPLLLDHFVQHAVQEGYRFSGIQNNALSKLVDYHWPGNVRELQSAVHYALIKSRGKAITERHLPAEVRTTTSEPPPPPDNGDPTGSSMEHFETPQDHTAVSGKRPKLTIDRVHIALDECRGNKVRAAERLGVGRATLYRFIKNHSL